MSLIFRDFNFEICFDSGRRLGHVQSESQDETLQELQRGTGGQSGECFIIFTGSRARCRGGGGKFTTSAGVKEYRLSSACSFFFILLTASS